MLLCLGLQPEILRFRANNLFDITLTAIDNAANSNAHIYDEATDSDDNNLLFASDALNLLTN